MLIIDKNTGLPRNSEPYDRVGPMFDNVSVRFSVKVANGLRSAIASIAKLWSNEAALHQKSAAISGVDAEKAEEAKVRMVNVLH